MRERLQAMLAERRVGFQIQETMRGTHVFLKDFPAGGITAGTEKPLAFTASWGHPRLDRFLNPYKGDFFRSAMKGTVSAGGLCEDVPLHGALELSYFSERKVKYRFEFAAEGRAYRYIGEKRDIWPWNLHRSYTTCFGAIFEVESGEQLCDSVVRFNLLQLPFFLASFKLG